MMTREERVMELLKALDVLITDMSLIDVTEKWSGCWNPIRGIDAVTFWYALRRERLRQRLDGAGRLLREF